MAIAVNSQTQTPPKWSLHSRDFRPGAWDCLSGYLEFSVRISPSDFCSHAHQRTRRDTTGSYAYTRLLQRTRTHQRARARPRLAAPLPGLHLHPRGQRVHARPARPAPLRPPLSRQMSVRRCVRFPPGRQAPRGRSHGPGGDGAPAIPEKGREEGSRSPAARDAGGFFSTGGAGPGAPGLCGSLRGRAGRPPPNRPPSRPGLPGR